MEENLERWRFTSERGGVKRSKVVRQIASVCEGEGEARGNDRTARSRGSKRTVHLKDW